MVRRVRAAGLVAGVAVYLLLMVPGCQKEQAATPQVEPPSAVTVPAGQAPVAVPAEGSLQAAAAVPQVPPATPVQGPSRTVAGAQKAQATKVEAEGTGAPVELALKFTVGQTATYKVTTETQKSIQWLGPASARPAGFRDARSGNYVEITFEQRVREVRDDGGAVVEVTIEALKYVSEMRSGTAVDFGSARDKDPNNALARLVGKKYGLQMSARGQVLALLDVEPIRQAVKGGRAENDMALKLLSDEDIKDRHEIAPLLALKDSPVRPGQTWSDVRTFFFGRMGAKSFERVYTFKGVEPKEGRLAVVEMKAIPSAAAAVQMHKEQTASVYSTKFDNVESYEGRLDLDLDHGQVRQYVEEMRTEWTIADPAGAPNGGPPAALKMGARRLHRLELLP